MGRWGYFFAGVVSALALLVAIGLFNVLDASRPKAIQVHSSLNEMLDKVNDGSIAFASIRGNLVIATTKAGQTFDTWVFSPEKMAERMVEKGVKVYTAGEEVSPPSLLGALINWLPFIIFVLAFWFAMGVPLYGIRSTLRRLEQASRAAPPA